VVLTTVPVRVMAVSGDVVEDVDVVVSGVVDSEIADELLVELGMVDILSVVVADHAGVIDALAFPPKLSSNPPCDEAASAAQVPPAAICEASAVTGVAIASVPHVTVGSELMMDASSSDGDHLGSRLR
jgi:hypothetical protein